jgi:UPF0755 protein
MSPSRPPVRGDQGWTEERQAPRPAADRDEYDEDGYEDDDELVYEEEPLDGTYDVLPRESSRGRRLLIVAVSLVALLGLLAFIVAGFVRGRLDPSGPPGDEVQVTIATGSTNGDIARLLEDEGVIPDSQFFELYLRAKGESGFQAGDYLFRENSAAWDALGVLQGSPLPPQALRFTVPEGLMLSEYPGQVVDDVPGFNAETMRQIIAAGELPHPIGIDTTTYEGFLFPDTYEIEQGSDERAALTRMVQQFDLVANELGLVQGAAALGRTPYEIVVIASLIQEEYGIPEEMNKIARVIYNRLDQGEPLGIDATSRYEAVLAGRDREDIDLESDSPYNTRRNPGLPPTPIAAPGRAALEAALHPADGPWIFYVRDPDESRTPPGGHFFTDSASEFAEVKAECEAAGLGCG